MRRQRKAIISRRPTAPVADAARALDRAVEVLGHFLQRTARKLARNDPGLAGDLYQEALIKLWELEPARFTEDELGYLARALLNHMLNLRRAFQRDQLHLISFETRMA